MLFADIYCFLSDEGQYYCWDVVWRVVSCYCPQADRSVYEKEEFYELMDKVVTSEVLVGGDFNCHVGKGMGGFGEVHGGFGDWSNK